MFTSSEIIKDLAEALPKAQLGYKPIGKDKTAKAGAYSYDYADLAACMDATLASLNANGLSVMQATQADGNVVTVTTRVLHSSGQWIESSLQGVAENASPQKIGSLCTYLRRYSYLGMIGAIPGGEDDDGAKAQPASGPPVAARVNKPKSETSKTSTVGPTLEEVMHRKNVALTTLENRFGMAHVRATLERVLEKPFPADKDIAMTLGDLVKVEAFVKAEVAP